VLVAATMLVVAVSAVATAAYLTPASWPALVAAWILPGMTYASIGAVAGAALGKRAATYLVLFLGLTVLGHRPEAHVRHGHPRQMACLLPGYGASRVMVDGAFSTGFHTAADLLFGLAWLAGLLVMLRRALGARPPAP
jgi:hypothetical protein